MVHDVRRGVEVVRVVVVMVVVVVVGQRHGGVGGARDGVHGVVGGVRFEGVSLALRNGDVHGRESLRASQQRLI